jgi:hypothetical protein
VKDGLAIDESTFLACLNSDFLSLSPKGDTKLTLVG